mmetsp:Transcript_18644/g.34827  ORF Transcript_18644/g.34827 Transcript_18644/m.34827 type:complete len:266 (-) Transcript_18644:13-810(-)
MVSSPRNDDADCHAAGAFVAAVINFPLWRASTLLLHGLKVEGQTQAARLVNAAFSPPYRATFASIFAMTWSRGAIFYGSDRGYNYLREQDCDMVTASVVPSLAVSSAVSVLNTPLIMGTLALQNPQTPESSIINYMLGTYRRVGLSGLFGGASLVMMRTVPKYAAIVTINNHLDDTLAGDRRLLKGPLAGAAAVVLTNPLDALHMHHTREEGKVGLLQIIRREGLAVFTRGVGANMVAVTIPISIAIAVTDMMKSWKYSNDDMLI